MQLAEQVTVRLTRLKITDMFSHDNAYIYIYIYIYIY